MKITDVQAIRLQTTLTEPFQWPTGRATCAPPG